MLPGPCYSSGLAGQLPGSGPEVLIQATPGLAFPAEGGAQPSNPTQEWLEG